MACKIPYIQNTNYSEAVKEKLEAEHRAIFERLKATGEFRYSTNSNGKQFMYIADPSKYSNVRNLQLKAIADVNASYQSRSEKPVVSVGKVASGKNVVQVDVSSLADYFDRTIDPVKKALYVPTGILKRSEGQYEANGEVFPTAEEAINELGEDSTFQDRTTGEGMFQYISQDQTALIHLLNKMKERTGIPYLITNKPKAEYKGRFTTINGVPTAEINIAHASSSTAIHEYNHAFVIAVRQEHPSMYSSLLSEVLQNHQDIVEKVRKLGYPESFVLEEALVRVLTQYAENPNLERPSIIAEFFLWLQDFLSSITGAKVTDLGVDLNLRKLSYEFMYSDDLYSKLESVRRLKSVDEFFEVTDNQFEKVTDTKEFKSIIDSALGKIETFQALIRSKPNLFSKKYREELGELQRQLERFKEGKEQNAQGKAMQAALDYLKRSAENTAKIKKQFTDAGGVYDQIREAIEKGEDLNPYIKELEAARNYFHLYGNFTEIADLAATFNRGETEGYTNTQEIKDFLKAKVEQLSEDQKYLDSLSTQQRTYFDQLKGLVEKIDNRPLTEKRVKNFNRLLGWIKNGKTFQAEFKPLIPDAKRARKDANAAISEVFDNINDVKREFQKNYLDVVTETLWKEVPKGAVIIRGKTEVPMTKELLREQLILADQDTGTLDTWLSATISSRDAVSGVVARMLKGVIYETGTSTAQERYKLQALYAKANPNNQAADEFHRKYISEMVTLPLVEGELQIAQEGDAYYESPVDGIRYKAEIRKRYTTQTRNDLRVVDEQLLRAEFGDLLDTDPEFFRSQLGLIGSGTVLSSTDEQHLRLLGVKELIPIINNLRTKDYTDSNYAQFANDEYYQTLLDLYERSNNSLPSDRRMVANEIPQKRNDISFSQKLGVKYKQFLDEVVNGEEGNWFTRFIEWMFKGFEAESTIDAEGGNTRTRQYLDGQQVYDIPIKLTQRIEPYNIEEDLLSSTLAFHHSTNTYKSFSDLEPSINALKTVLRGDPDMNILARQASQTQRDEKAYNSKVKQFLIKKTNLNINKRLEEFVNDTLFGEDNLDDFQFKVGAKTYSVSKIANGLLGFSSIQNIAFNWIAGISNALTGNVNTFSLAVGGKYFTTKEFGEAKREYWGNIQNSLHDFSVNDINQKSKIGQLIIQLDAIQGEFFGLDGKVLNQSQSQKLLTTNTLFFNQNATEHEVQVTGMIALMKATKIGEKSMWDLVKKGDNGLEWDPSVTQADIESLKHKLHALSKQLHGNYNKFDKSALQRRWYGRLVLMFRKYLYTSFRSRFGAKKYDYELEDVTSGYYRDAWNVGVSFFRKLGKDIRDWESLSKNYDDLDANGKAAIRRTTFELSVVVGALILGKALASIELDDDDEFLSMIRDNTQLQMLRLSRDFMVYVPFQSAEEFVNVAKAPSLIIPVASKMVRFANQLLPWNISEEFEKKTGSYQKGDNKAFAYGLRTVPILRQFISLMNPSDNLKFYTMLNKNAQ
jgi:hypothetical protein